MGETLLQTYTIVGLQEVICCRVSVFFHLVFHLPFFPYVFFPSGFQYMKHPTISAGFYLLFLSCLWFIITIIKALFLCKLATKGTK